MKSKSSSKKVALVTGGASGIGAATAMFFAERGCSVALMDVAEKGESVAARITDRGGDCTFLKVDVSKENQVERAVKRAYQKYKRVDCLLNIAGIVLVKPLEEVSWEEYRRTFDVNMGGMFLVCKHVIPIMKRQRGGVIVNMASVSGHVGQVRHVLYGATKGAIIAFSRALAVELAPYGIRVNSISPGSVDTPMLRSDVTGEAGRLKLSFGEVRKQREAEQLLGRWADAREIAEAVYYLAGEGASFVTGTDLLVDGGWTAK